MEKIKEIYLTKKRIDGMSDYSSGLILVTEKGEIFEETTTDVLEAFTKSKLTLEQILSSNQANEPK